MPGPRRPSSSRAETAVMRSDFPPDRFFGGMSCTPVQRRTGLAETGIGHVHARRPSSAVHRHPDMRLQHVFHPHRSAGQPPPGGHLLGPPREDGGRCRPGWRHQAAPIRAIRRRMRPAPRDAASGSGSGAVRPASSPARRAGGPVPSGSSSRPCRRRRATLPSLPGPVACRSACAGRSHGITLESDVCR